MTNKQIYVTLSAGHSTICCGAVAEDGTTEAELVTQFRNIVAYYVQQDKDIHLKVDGYNKQNLPLKEAVKLIKGSSISLEFHMNSATNKTAQGVEVLSQEKDKAVSQQIAKAIADVMGSKLRGDKGWKSEGSGQHSRLAWVSNGGILVEIEFLSNKERLQVFKDKMWLVGKAVAQVVLDYVKTQKQKTDLLEAQKQSQEKEIADEHKLAEERCIGLYNDLVDSEDVAEKPDTNNKE